MSAILILTHTHTHTHRLLPPLNSLFMTGCWARSWYTNVFSQSAGWQTRLVNDGSPLRPVLYMFAPLRKVRQVLVNKVYPVLQGSPKVFASFHVVGISEPASMAGFLAFFGGDQTTANAYGAAVLLQVIHQFLPRCQHFSSCPIASPQQSLAGTSFGRHEVS